MSPAPQARVVSVVKLLLFRCISQISRIREISVPRGTVPAYGFQPERADPSLSRRHGNANANTLPSSGNSAHTRPPSDDTVS